jgi:hypothetical protein
MLRIRRQRLTNRRPTVSSEKLDSLTIDAIAHRDETDHRIVQQLGGRAIEPGNREGPPVNLTEPRDIVVIGASRGDVEALKGIVAASAVP